MKVLIRWSWVFLLLHCMWRGAFAIGCDETVEGDVGTEGVISAPNFPVSYPRQSSFYMCTYTLRNLNDTGFIRLVFDDFHLSNQVVGVFQNGTKDYLQIDLKNGRGPSMHVGASRPDVQLSPGTEVVIVLGVQAYRPETYAGFRTFSAKYSFISAEEKSQMEMIYTDTRTLIPEVSMEQGNIAYTVQAPRGSYTGMDIDIIWYIEATEPNMNILLVVEQFSKAGSSDVSSLMICQGLTSASPPAFFSQAAPSYHIVSTGEYLYVRWQGRTEEGAVFKAYFNYYIQAGSGMQCPADYFTCANDRCVMEQLTCNANDNCGDDSDEDSSTVCYGRPTSSPQCNPPCLNEGLCVGALCQCPEGVFGEYCQFRNESGTDFTDLQHTSIMIGAFVGAVCLLSVCWLIAMARKRYNDEPPVGGHLSRIVSIHTPEEVGLRRNTTIHGEQDIPPDYSQVCRRDSRRGSLLNGRRGSFPKRYRMSIDYGGPLSPPPSYEIVTGEAIDRTDSRFSMPDPSYDERNNLPDVVNGDPAAPEPSESAPQLTTLEMEAEPPAEPQDASQAPDDAGTTTTVRICQDTLV